jgi:hypothetical protein
MPLTDSADDSLLKLAESLRELEIVIGEKARPAISQVRAQLGQAVDRRKSGDVPGALGLIRLAMERLAALGSELDAHEGAMMRAIAHRFTQALGFGDKSGAQEAVDQMRLKAGDTKDKGPADW